MNKNTLIFLTASLIGTQVWAGDVTIPNTFSDGTTASAGEVNSNFSAIETAINDNSANIQTNTSKVGVNTTAIATNTDAIAAAATQQGISVKANGTRIGEYITTVYSDPKNEVLYALTDKGYIFGIDVKLHYGKIAGANYAPPNTTFVPHITFLYKEADCKGQAYVTQSSIQEVWAIGPIAHGTGYVFNYNDETLYIPRNATPEPAFVFASKQINSRNCFSAVTDPGLIETVLILPNDPNVTGVVSKTVFQKPLSIGR